MNFAFLVLLLALIWAAVTGGFSLLNLLLGAAIGTLAVWFIRNQVAEPVLARRAMRIVKLVALFFSELAVSAYRVAVLVASPNMHKKLKPAIFAYPLTVKSDSEITLLANLMTLTPGTLSMDVADDRSVIYVHALELLDKQETIASVRNGFEARIMEVFEK